MVWLIGAVTLALVAMSATWGTIGTAVILVTGVAWLLFAFQPIQAGALVAFQPIQAGALVANLARRRLE